MTSESISPGGSIFIKGQVHGGHSFDYLLDNDGNVLDLGNRGEIGGNPKCKIQLPPGPTSTPRFQTGRVDCKPDPSLPRPYFTNRKENHPRLHANGPTTAKYYHDNFQMGSMLSVALHGGAHSFGTFNDAVSGLRYTWTRAQEFLLNNQFFQILALKHMHYAVEQSKGGWHVTGDWIGRKSKATWYLKKARKNFQFFHLVEHCSQEFLECSDLISPAPKPLKNPRKCCKDLPGNDLCRRKGPDSRGCVRNFNVNKNDLETAIPADVGLAWHFEIDEETQQPIGCSGLANGVPTGPDAGTFPECPKEEFKAINYHWRGPAANDKSLNQIVNEYAEDNEHWVRHFYRALEVMLSNGYADRGLNDPNKGWFQLGSD